MECYPIEASLAVVMTELANDHIVLHIGVSHNNGVRKPYVATLNSYKVAKIMEFINRPDTINIVIKEDIYIMTWTMWREGRRINETH